MNADDSSMSPGATHDALIAGLAARAGELSTAAEDLRDTYRFSRWLKATLILGAVVLIANAAMLAILIGLANTNRQNGDAIRSCTTPEGKCYRDGRTQTAQAVAEIVAQVNAHTDLVLLSTLECSRAGVDNQHLAACLRAKGL